MLRKITFARHSMCIFYVTKLRLKWQKRNDFKILLKSVLNYCCCHYYYSHSSFPFYLPLPPHLLSLPLPSLLLNFFLFYILRADLILYPRLSMNRPCSLSMPWTHRDLKCPRKRITWATLLHWSTYYFTNNLGPFSCSTVATYTLDWR